MKVAAQLALEQLESPNLLMRNLHILKHKHYLLWKALVIQTIDR